MARMGRVSHENVPIGERLVPNVWPHQQDALSQVLEAIDAVHLVPDSMPNIPVQTERSLDASGAYIYDDTGEANAICIWALAARPCVTLTHEIGHFIDHKGLGGALPGPLTGLPAERRKLPRNVCVVLDDWDRAVWDSEGVQHLIALWQDPFVRIRDGSVIDVSTQIDFGYLLRTEELWARSYVQYVATKSANPMLASELSELVDSRERAMVSITQQWTHADFRAIMTALDHLFGELGWLR
jgi:hypothetical protein